MYIRSRDYPNIQVHIVNRWRFDNITFIDYTFKSKARKIDEEIEFSFRNKTVCAIFILSRCNYV